MAEYSKTTELLYQGTTVRGMDFNHPLVIPYYSTTAFKVQTLAEVKEMSSKKFSYVRFSNPNREVLAEIVSFLEEGEKSLIFESGMGAITTTLMTLLSPGDEVICNSNIYGETFQVMTEVLPKFGVCTKLVDFCDVENVKKTITPKTAIVYTEVCANPVLKMADIPAIANIAHKNNAILMVDNTFTSPIVIRPLTLGADIVINSMTKFMNGHSDAIGGSVTSRTDIIAKIDRMRPLFGTSGDPYASYTMYKNFGTMDLRIKKQTSNAAKLAKVLEDHKHIIKVNHPSLTSFPQHELAMRLFKSDELMCGMMSIVLPEAEGDDRTALVDKFTSHLKFVRYASTLGGIHTTLMHPVTSSHCDVPDTVRRAMGITPGLLRVSVGIEDPDDLIQEFSQALDSLDQ